ncbi:hybrid sensor histidine kinase/response regulator [Isoalcanivorax indicus]|uniref:hybrid sensor histidine kinase/response regulator n=1 Tax=Isoalcanivorax indicus TaxID=2202653 RepID=UPI000DBABF09|nr:hybrid sensor histidine kinase/response regulator [Isoalcanivorax indicus]
MDRQHPLSDQVNKERLDWMVREILPHFAGGIFGAALIGVVFAPVAREGGLMVWALLNLAIGVAGAVLLLGLRRHYQRLPIAMWVRLSGVMLLLWGMVLATAPWLFDTASDPAYFVTLIVLLIGICASPSATLALYPLIYAAFVTPVMASLGWSILVSDFIDNPLMKWLTPIFWAFLVGYTWRLHGVLINAITSRLEKDDALRKLERSNQLRSRFLAAATHDIRQPLQAISLHLSVLGERFSDHAEADLLKRLHDSTASMSTLMDTLLDVSRLDNQDIRPSIRTVALKPLLEQWVGQYALMARDKGLALHMALADVVVRTDPLLLERIVLNLFSNAVRYTEAGAITVRLREDKGEATLSVSDTGHGIAEEEQEHIFEAFHQIDTPLHEQQRGMGLGLAIVDRLAALLAHPIQLQSEPGIGSTFSLTLPTGRRKDLLQHCPPPAPEWEMNGLNVLILDDNPEVLDALRALLSNWQCQVRAQASATPEETWQPDFILSDYHLTSGDTGLDTVKRFRDYTGRCIPAAILTGDQNLTLPETLPRTALLRKPVRPAQLRSVMQKMLRREGIASRRSP